MPAQWVNVEIELPASLLLQYSPELSGNPAIAAGEYAWYRVLAQENIDVLLLVEYGEGTEEAGYQHPVRFLPSGSFDTAEALVLDEGPQLLRLDAGPLLLRDRLPERFSFFAFIGLPYGRAARVLIEIP
ncbi:hypothetical protein A3SI_02913 [Nitritalea halalkaliphila LW7]|uniref:Uncharacterized protein n=1 Tax=Nitritalea halalkaliphila LW7 TaxID=1189621 RepID=I5C9H1_9BACT|nr:hypothetical protein [Nitritalea halalkaliphila]EIM78473.1 hypothetical protein A3SI_02913 [Nitritalea halalkaliphila LW7]